MAKLTAVISGTVRDLPEHRKAAIDACLKLGILPKAAELTGAVRPAAFDSCVDEFGNPDVYIGIIGFRYGYVPQGADRSVTELEYQLAEERGVPRLLFLMDREHPLTIDAFDTGVAFEKLTAFRKRLEAEHIVGFFKSPAELGQQLVEALTAFVKQRESFSSSARGTGMVHAPGLEQRDLLRVLLRHRRMCSRSASDYRAS